MELVADLFAVDVRQQALGDGLQSRLARGVHRVGGENALGQLAAEIHLLGGGEAGELEPKAISVPEDVRPQFAHSSHTEMVFRFADPGERAANQ
jgi:hypothetical protein